MVSSKRRLLIYIYIRRIRSRIIYDVALRETHNCFWDYVAERLRALRKVQNLRKGKRRHVSLRQASRERQ